MIDIQKHRDTLALATHGPWEAITLDPTDPYGFEVGIYAPGLRMVAATDSLTDAAFIEAAPAMWREAVDEVAELRGQVARLEKDRHRRARP